MGNKSLYSFVKYATAILHCFKEVQKVLVLEAPWNYTMLRQRKSTLLNNSTFANKKLLNNNNYCFMLPVKLKLCCSI